MPTIHAETALLPDGWAENVTVTITDGRISSLVPVPADLSVGLLLPAPGNVHSHAFQRAMAGLTEAHGSTGAESFWTWRNLMFRFLDHLSPEDAQAIAAQVQMEMLEAGYAAVGEFHYLHHQPGGTPYADLSEMSARICAAADQTGIGLTLLPVAYQTGGVDGRPLAAGQVRFGNDPDRFARLLERAADVLSGLPADARLGAAPHSLRAVPATTLAEIPTLTDGPLHMHLAEQVAEVDEIKAAYGARPVDWALEHIGLGPRWCLIHCTQMTPAETDRLAQSGAVAGLCPITEASLGDGIFDGVRWLAANGRIAIGSDSNIRIALAEELRQLEYSQRQRAGPGTPIRTDRRRPPGRPRGTGPHRHRSDWTLRRHGAGHMAGDLRRYTGPRCLVRGPPSGTVGSAHSAARDHGQLPHLSDTTGRGALMSASWQEVHAEALRRIQTREWTPGTLIPKEAALAEELGCVNPGAKRVSFPV